MKQLRGMYMESAWNIVQSGGDPKAAGYGSATVRVRNPDDLDTIEKQIRKMGFHTKTMLARLQDMQRFFLGIRLLLTVVGGIALTIAALGIANTLLMAVMERFQEIGLCKAIGASDGDLFVLFLTEAAVIGFLGGASGIALGWLVSWGMEALATLYAHRAGNNWRTGPFRLPLVAYRGIDGLCDRGQRGGRHLSGAAPRGSIRSGPCGRIEGKRRFVFGIRRTFFSRGLKTANSPCFPGVFEARCEYDASRTGVGSQQDASTTEVGRQ